MIFLTHVQNACTVLNLQPLLLVFNLDVTHNQHVYFLHISGLNLIFIFSNEVVVFLLLQHSIFLFSTNVFWSTFSSKQDLGEAGKGRCEYTDDSASCLHLAQNGSSSQSCYNILLREQVSAAMATFKAEAEIHGFCIALGTYHLLLIDFQQVALCLPTQIFCLKKNSVCISPSFPAEDIYIYIYIYQDGR